MHGFGAMLNEDKKEILVSTLIGHCVSACPELKLPKLSKYENESLFFFTLYFTNSSEKYVWIHLDNVSMQPIYLNDANFYVPTKRLLCTTELMTHYTSQGKHVFLAGSQGAGKVQLLIQ